jgi:hypothetical protein
MSSCPGCGAELEYSVETTRVLTGTCGQCQRVTTLIEGPLPPGTPTASPPGSGDEAAGSAATPGAPECAECGSPLAVRVQRDGSLEVSCEECETTSRFVPEGAGEGPRGRGREDRRPPREPPGGGGPRARPCRQCGAPLTFTTDEDGQLVGECRACGNRFTLPPRRNDFGGRAERPGRFPPRGPSRYPRRPAGWSGGEGRSYGGPRHDVRRRSDSDEDGDDRRRRRRPRRA